MPDSLDHGGVGKAEPPFTSFTQILGQRDPAGMLDPKLLAGLAHYMANAPDSLSDNPDPEENLYIPAGYTYLGQFVDHDLTLDTTSTLNPDDARGKANEPTNLRSPRFDLDCVYGNGPDDQPYMYAGVEDAARGVWKDATLVIGAKDLARAHNGAGVNGPGDPAAWGWSRAIIGDKRNDENSIVNQIQQLLIRFHNKVVDGLARADATLRGKVLFRRARDTVRWSYQSILLQDFLPRLVEASVLSNFLSTRHYEVYPDDERRLRSNLPREFVAAVYRYGHSGVRQGYRLNGGPGPLESPSGGGTILPIFSNPDTDPLRSLIGFDPLPTTHVIDDWRRFFPIERSPHAGERLISDPSPDYPEVSADGKSGGNGTVRLQYAYKLDPSLVDPLLNLPAKIATQQDVQPPELRNQPPRVENPQPDTPWGPSLALLNLLRGNRYLLQSGQAYEQLVRAIPLDPKYLCVRISTDTGDGKVYSFTRIKDLIGLDGQPLGETLECDTPLWFYILAEAQRPLVDFWLEAGRDLTEDDLKGRDEAGHPITIPDGADPDTVEKALRDTRCTGTQLGPVGGRIVTEVFYGLMESDPDSIFGPRKPAGWAPPFGAQATMGHLIRWTLGA